MNCWARRHHRKKSHTCLFVTCSLTTYQPSPRLKEPFENDASLSTKQDLWNPSTNAFLHLRTSRTKNHLRKNRVNRNHPRTSPCSTKTRTWQLLRNHLTWRFTDEDERLSEHWIPSFKIAQKTTRTTPNAPPCRATALTHAREARSCARKPNPPHEPSDALSRNAESQRRTPPSSKRNKIQA